MCHHRPETDAVIYIGRIGKTHGLAGDLRLYPLSDVPNRFEGLKSVWWESASKTYKRLKVVEVRPGERFFLIRFENFSNPESAASLVNGLLAIEKSERGELPEGRFFIDDVIGLSVVDVQDNVVGIVKDVLQPGTNDIYEISGPNGTILIPAIDDYVLLVDIKKRKVIVNVPEYYD